MAGTPTCRASNRMCSRVWRHGAVSSRNDQNRAVHLRRSGNHILDVVRVTRAIDVSIVALVRLILHVGDIDSNASFSFSSGALSIWS